MGPHVNTPGRKRKIIIFRGVDLINKHHQHHQNHQILKDQPIEAESSYVTGLNGPGPSVAEKYFLDLILKVIPQIPKSKPSKERSSIYSTSSIR